MIAVEKQNKTLRKKAHTHYYVSNVQELWASCVSQPKTKQSYPSFSTFSVIIVIAIIGVYWKTKKKKLEFPVRKTRILSEGKKYNINFII